MAYSLESLIKIIEQILHPHPLKWTLDPYRKPEVESLLVKIQALKLLLANSSRIEIGSLENRIRDAAYGAEDILESYLADRIRSVGAGASFIFSPPSLQKLVAEFDSVEEEIKKMTTDIGSHTPEVSQPLHTAVTASLRRIDPNPKKILVGLSEDSFQLKDRLTRPDARREVIPVVGMGGIGKTTLARNVYDDPLIRSHFDICAWVTVSQEYNARLVLLGLLECVIVKLTDEMREMKNNRLALLLHKSLWGRRYLVVVDDIWDNEAWDDIKRFFPDDENGSRVIVTTREMSVANNVGSSRSLHQMHLLNNDDSWDLLQQKVFAQETCPPELVTIGKRIANNCKGLPLAIRVVSGVLSQARTHDFWQQVAKDVTSVATNNSEQISKILSLSYKHLPNYLKPCFLYMGVFPEDYKIRSSRLIRLWVAEGFLEPVANKSLEETAEMYLKALVDRNLFSQEISGTVKRYGMHDLLRDLCVREAHEKKFLYVKNGVNRKFPSDKSSLRRVSIHPFLRIGDDWQSYRGSQIYDKVESMSLARSFLYVGSASWVILSPVVFSLLVLRVLDILGTDFYEFPEEILQLVNLRYLAFACGSPLPLSISTLRNLQTIICRNTPSFMLPKTTERLFDMPCLRHIKFLGGPTVFCLGFLSTTVLGNLQTLSGIRIWDDVEALVEFFPDLNKLGISDLCSNSKIDLTGLSKLRTLKCSSGKPELALCSLVFPPSLKKLTLDKYTIPIAYMNQIGTLPNLEVLKLTEVNLESSTWEPTEGEFSRLQLLLLEGLNLVKWDADGTHFPRLEYLVIRYCSELEDIPSGIGEIPTLETIQVHECSPSAVASARRIQEEQLELGNNGLQVLITGLSE